MEDKSCEILERLDRLEKALERLTEFAPPKMLAAQKGHFIDEALAHWGAMNKIAEALLLRASRSNDDELFDDFEKTTLAVLSCPFLSEKGEKFRELGREMLKEWSDVRKTDLLFTNPPEDKEMDKDA